jgi:DNA topoisomerase-1
MEDGLPEGVRTNIKSVLYKQQSGMFPNRIIIEGDFWTPLAGTRGLPESDYVGTFEREIRLSASGAVESVIHHKMYVKEDWQGMGIGGAFVTRSMQAAKDAGAKSVEMTAYSDDYANGVATWVLMGFDGQVSGTGRALSPLDASDIRKTMSKDEIMRDYGKGRGTISADLTFDLSKLSSGEQTIAAALNLGMFQRALDGELTEYLEPPPPTDISATVELACHSAACAPPPVGRGGSLHAGMHRASAAERKSFAVPPAWTDVHISDDPNAALIVRGVDSKGRSQYRYSAEHTASAGAVKFERVKQLHKQIDALDATLSVDAMTRPEAGALLLIRHFGMRPGSTRETGADVQAYGATTLEARHVQQDAVTGRTTIAFTAKKGVDVSVTTLDPVVYKSVSLAMTGKQGSDRLFDTTASRTQRYMRSVVPGGFKLKDLRTYKANAIARMAMFRKRRPKTAAQFSKMRLAVADQVAAQLGNTRTVALNSYINPTVFAPWEASIK